MKEFTLELPVRYYETDQMAIVHHSNYVRYCETARIGFLYDVGLDFAAFEQSGYVSPVLNVNLNFKRPARFGDTVRIKTWIRRFNGVRIWFGYDIRNQAGTLLCDGESVHAFCDKALKPVMLQKVRPDLYQKLADAATERN